MKNKLWQTDASEKLNPQVEAYTVGNDYEVDQRLLGYDIQASKAHASMLLSAGILKKTEEKKMAAALDKLHKDWSGGFFSIQPGQEDAHTAIESYLVAKLGTLGKKIHTARSRNDQSLVMMRLFLINSLKKTEDSVIALAKTFEHASVKAGKTPMPGYTHGQKAMPTKVSTWLKSYADALLDMQKLISATLEVIDQNPLGSAAGFGVDLKIDRSYTTKALKFKKIQQNPMYCGLSRGLFELLFVQALNPLMALVGKFAQDMLLFTTQEFGFFSLPKSFTTGSSIMPHKHNYDLFEVMRAKAIIFSSYAQTIYQIFCSAGSGYHRDLQLTKQITLNAFDTLEETLMVADLAVKNLQIHHKKLNESMTPEMMSVSEVNNLVKQGVPFRDAYVQVKKKLNKS